MYGILGPGGFTTVIFANTLKTALKPMATLPTNMLVGVSVCLTVLCCQGNRLLAVGAVFALQLWLLLSQHRGSAGCQRHQQQPCVFLTELF
jgi:hypothetical protein